ncbi:MAG: HPr family phosphocarrier protein [Deltaproteobacteria bacterium]|nr:HPr family phosphocarrier protein [Deltaproteobacteria bacterium]
MPTDFLTLFDSEEDQEIISEKEFGRIFAPFAGPFLTLSHYVEESVKEGDGELLNMDFLANVIKHASDVERLLDRYRARNNRNWVYFRELSATAKNFGKAAFLLEELKKNANPERLFPREAAHFTERAETVGHFLAGIVSRSFEELQKEAQRLKLAVPQDRPLPRSGAKLRNEIILPHTIEESAFSDKVHTVKKIVHRFVDFAEEARSLEEVIRPEIENLASNIPGNVNEGKLRRLGTRLHNFQSWYDSYVENSRMEGEIPELKGLRQIFPAQLSLFKIATILAHYYERHLLIPSSPIVDRLRKIVPSSWLVEEAFHFTLYYLVQLFHVGRNLAESILNRLVEIVTYELPVPKVLGFHARPSTRVVKVVQHYGADVKMLVDDQVFDTGSVLQMLSAGGYIHTKGLDRVLFRGDKRALDDLRILAEHNYGETRDGKDIPLPDALSYLR